MNQSICVTLPKINFVLTSKKDLLPTHAYPFLVYKPKQLDQYVWSDR